MIKSLCILGRQPALGVAELESIYGHTHLSLIGSEIAGLDISTDKIHLSQLGGTIKLCSVVGELSTTNWPDMEHLILDNLDTYMPTLESGKLLFGISVYDVNASVQQIQATGLRLKQALKHRGQSARLVPNQLPKLNSAQVLHNRLDSKKGVELILARDGESVYVARTTGVQNITSYTYRDRSRPKRDTRVGMLPPKLAQIIINLAKPPIHGRLLDPFCGTGVILQEAGLMGLEVYGSDLEARMIEYSETNLGWLRDNFGRPRNWTLEVGDATNHRWQAFDAVASELYLGQPFSAFPSLEKLHSVIHTCDQITRAFLKNIHPQLKPDTHLSLAVPAWQDPKSGSFYHLPALDQIELLGYNRVSFSHTTNQELIYYRPGQVVGRQLIVIKRK